MSSDSLSHAPPFFAHLGLGSDVDARAVKKAYAQRLKLIDQALDPEAFQALRTAYEQALHWLDQARQRRLAEEQDASPAGTDASDPIELADAIEPEHPPEEVSAQQEHPALEENAFQLFGARLRAGFLQDQDARLALDEALAHEQLINLEARTQFEWQVACLLAEGWQPGHEFLFGPACEAFNWKDDRRRLAFFGNVGAVIDAAIGEKIIFFQNPPADFERQRKLIKRLRDPSKPSDRALKAEMGLLRMLIERYPNWLRQITSQPNIAQWHQWFEEIPRTPEWAQEPFAQEKPAPAMPNGKFLLWAMLVCAVIVLTLWNGRESKRYGDFKPPQVQPWQVSQPETSKLKLPGDEPFVALNATPGRTRPPVAEAGAGQAKEKKKQVVQAPAQAVLAEPLQFGEFISETPAAEGESQQLGNVQLTMHAGRWTVESVAARTGSASSSMRQGDVILSCAAGSSQSAPGSKIALQRCALDKRFINPGEVAQYLFTVQRAGTRTQGLITLRD